MAQHVHLRKELGDDALLNCGCLASAPISVLALALLGLKFNATIYDTACEVSFSRNTVDYVYQDSWWPALELKHAKFMIMKKV